MRCRKAVAAPRCPPPVPRKDVDLTLLQLKIRDLAAQRGFELLNPAKRITGAHWSGPRFFGLLAAGAERPSNADP
jgi:hypothetical protein